jgi:putative CocE/NonD family hydrolase
VLLMRTPYGKGGKNFNAQVRAGYVVICQDARGRYASDGQYESFVRAQTHDGEDGYDTVEWAAKLPYSNGRVGTFGASYNAFLQWKLAALRPPSLVAMAASSIAARYTDLEGPGAIRPGRRLLWWYGTMSPDLRQRSGRTGPQTTQAAAKLWAAGEGERLLNFLPWLDLPDSVFEDETQAVKAWLRHHEQDPWQLDRLCQEIAVPNLDVVGWYDHCNGSIELHHKMVAEGYNDVARRGQLVIGPWSHSGRGNPRQGKVNFGPAAKMDLTQAEIRWFDYWLKEEANGVDQQSPVRIFVMGANRWRDEPHWPPERATPREWFLSSGGHANTPAGDGSLNAIAPTTEGRDRYQYDPRDPVPTLWTPKLFTVPADQRAVAKRQDILVYQTEPLETELEVTGYPEVVLHASSSAPDTDFFARLIDVAPDGTAIDVAYGMVRARYRRGLDRPELLKPGEPTKFVIRLRPTSNLFLAGHRIRLDITSSDFPNYDRNHNTAADQNADATLETAEQTILHGPGFGSKLILPTL